MTDRAAHWEGVYGRVEPTEVSWYQREPATSVRLVRAVTPDRGAAVIDVGAGESTLVDRLLDDGFQDITVLDVSQRALDDVRARLDEGASAVSFVCRDVLDWEPERQYDTWHDRAVFHFLTDPEDRARYVALVSGAVRAGGSVVLATFAEDGPLQCSGLPVARYSADDLAVTFEATFERIDDEREEHHTPSGAVQPFTWVVLRRR